MPKLVCAECLRLAPAEAESYRQAIQILSHVGIPALVGGAYALAYYTGVVRTTKDFDLFIRPSDLEQALTAFRHARYRTETVFPYWLAKVFRGDDMIDLIYRAPNGVVEVSDEWIERAWRGELLNVPVQLCSPESILATKLFVLNNYRSDVADVMHLFYSCAERIDWQYLLHLLQSYWRVLLAQLILFGFVYPSERHRIPPSVLHELTERLSRELNGPAAAEPVCNGPLLYHSQYKIDLQNQRFHDGRLQPFGAMTPLDLINSTISMDDPDRPRILASLPESSEVKNRGWP